MVERLNRLVGSHTPCFFYTDFTGNRFHCYTLEELEHEDIEFAFHTDAALENSPHQPSHHPITKTEYRQRFERVIEEIRSGNTYLLNLTQPTAIESSLDLRQIYAMAHAPYKLRVRNEFVCFSPESFITIENDTIHTFPMKGTIDASMPDAIETILNDPKETAEHTMIVDLLRNDMGIVANSIRVERFRYITTINTGERELHQVSSHISGKLQSGWETRAGDMIRQLLPAGSISGTPKRMTVNLIQQIEEYERGYYTGIFGYYDGKCLRSAVSIRYIEDTGHGLVYKSGGGITAESEWEKEYEEMIAKVYIP